MTRLNKAESILSTIKWKRGSKFALSKYFNSKEFECQCGVCEEQAISSDLIGLLTSLREDVGLPFKITSGYRCVTHQSKILNNPNIQTVKNSQHVLGNAADVACSDLNLLFTKAPNFFDAVGDGRKKGFVHLDVRHDKKRTWLY